MEITSEFSIKDKILNLSNTSEDLRKSHNILNKPQVKQQNLKSITPLKYQRPCTVLSNNSEEFLDQQLRKPKQRPVCHSREFKEAFKKSFNAKDYIKSTERRVSIASR